MRWRLVVCDVDGTLVDSTPSVVAAVRHALAALGAAVAPDDDLAWCVGPPLHESFAALLGRADAVPDAVELYREFYRREAHALTTLIPGAREAVAAMRDAGLRLAACTYKPGPVAVAVLRQAGFDGVFEAVVGAAPSGIDPRTKAELLAETATATGVPPAATLYVGDHDLDEPAAQAAGMAFARVGPGHHSWDDIARLATARVAPGRPTHDSESESSR